MATLPTPAVLTDAGKLAADAKAAGQAAVPQVEKAATDIATEVKTTATEVVAEAKPVIEDAHKMIDDIKAATNQLQVHELAEKLRAWIKSLFV